MAEPGKTSTNLAVWIDAWRFSHSQNLSLSSIAAACWLFHPTLMRFAPDHVLRGILQTPDPTLLASPAPEAGKEAEEQTQGLQWMMANEPWGLTKPIYGGDRGKEGLTDRYAPSTSPYYEDHFISTTMPLTKCSVFETIRLRCCLRSCKWTWNNCIRSFRRSAFTTRSSCSPGT